MLEVLTSIPSYKPETFSGITEEEYNNTVEEIRRHINRAFVLFEAYWKTSNTTLFDLSLEALGRADTAMFALMDKVTDEGVTIRISRRATFTMDLAAAMMGTNNGKE